ncbi:hypothetical protein Mapa_004405 [Marchantia paleacea]|nr:hypothetical protein Mapa_004405 [Marchantia paleacea]
MRPSEARDETRPRSPELRSYFIETDAACAGLGQESHSDEYKRSKGIPPRAL